MSEWQEAGTGVKFLCWGKIKDSIEDPNDAVVIKMTEKLEGLVQRITEEKDKDGNIETYKLFVKTKKYDEPVMVWANASMKRQIADIGVVDGDEIQLIYTKDYKAKNGKIGKEIKVRVKKQ